MTDSTSILYNSKVALLCKPTKFHDQSIVQVEGEFPVQIALSSAGHCRLVLPLCRDATLLSNLQRTRYG